MVYTLKELVNIKYGKNQKKVENPNGLYPIYGTGGLMSYANEFLYDKPSVLIGRKGTINKVKYVDKPFWTVDTLFYTKVNEELVIPKYLFYKMSTLDLNDYNEGTTIPSLRTDTLYRIELDIPNKEEQDKVVKILNSIDKKIELNNQINNNLYEIMRLNFKGWIENLEDYEISNLSSIANYKNGLAMQKYRPENEVGLPVIKIKEMNSGLSEETERCKSDIDPEVIINDGDVLFAWSGTLCMTIWDSGKAGLNQHIFKVTSDKYPKWFYYFWTLKHLDKFIQIAAGKATTMGHIKRGELDNSEVLIPSSEELYRMNQIMSPMLDKYIENKLENRNLEQLRDTLLPKLMNGEIDLENIEI